jgi:hypothetical protein
MWELVLFVSASAVEQQWTREDAEQFHEVHSAFTEMYGQVHGNGDGSLSYDVDLPDGWTYNDVVEKCGQPGDEKEHSAADCFALVPHLLQGYWDEIKTMEEGFRAENPKPLLPSEGWTHASSLLETNDKANEKLSTKDLIKTMQANSKLAQKHFQEMHNKMKNRAKVHLMNKDEIKVEAKRILAEMHSHKGQFAPGHHHAHTRNNKFMNPKYVKSQIKKLDQLQHNLKLEYKLRKERDAPILTDLKKLQEQQKMVSKQEAQENKEDVEESKSMARKDWERAHAVRPPRADPGKPGDPNYQKNLKSMWKDAMSRATEEDSHEAQEMERMKKFTERHRTPSPSQVLERQLVERMMIDDGKLEGREPTQNQLVQAGMAKPAKTKAVKKGKQEVQLAHRLKKDKERLVHAKKIAENMRKAH